MADDDNTSLAMPCATLPRELNLRYEGERYSGMSREEDKLWTDGPQASLGFALPSELKQDVAIRFDLLAFVWPDVVPSQQVQVYLDGSKIGGLPRPRGASS
jgi:hypothetical protein